MNDRQKVSNMKFATDTGIEVPSVSEGEMREADRIAVVETGPNLYQMMENAGRNLALQAMDMLGAGWESANIVVLAGTGGKRRGRDMRRPAFGEQGGAGKTFCI